MRGILVDTSVWIKHLKVADQSLIQLLEENRVLVHDFIIGEISCGQLKKRGEFLSLLQTLPRVEVIEHHDVLYMIEENRLYSSGIGWVDAHLLASTLSEGAQLWTSDKKLAKSCHKMGCDFF